MEINDLKKKMGQMKRNFDSVSHYSASDKAEFSKLRNMKEQYEQEIKTLKFETSRLAKETKEQKDEIKELQTKLSDITKKLEDKTRELERLNDILKKKDKQHEDR